MSDRSRSTASFTILSAQASSRRRRFQATILVAVSNDTIVKPRGQRPALSLQDARPRPTIVCTRHAIDTHVDNVAHTRDPGSRPNENWQSANRAAKLKLSTKYQSLLPG